MAFLLPNGQRVAIDTPFVWDDIQYPANWFRLSSPEVLEELGITEVPEDPYYDQQFYWGPDLPKDLDELKNHWITETSNTANTLLAPSDWYIIREADNGVECPPSIKTWRQDIRELSTAKRTTISACQDVDALVTYLKTTNPDDISESYGFWPAFPNVE